MHKIIHVLFATSILIVLSACGGPITSDLGTTVSAAKNKDVCIPDGYCNSGETVASCPVDCGPGSANPDCGDGTCQVEYETASSCELDCASSGGGGGGGHGTGPRGGR